MKTARRGAVAAAIALSALVPVVAGDAGGAGTAGAATSYDLRSYYPNPTLAFGGFYLEGFNYTTGTPQRSVLWFEDLGRGTFRQYNSAPFDRCHYDQLTWQSTRLVYSVTHHECEGPKHDTIYSPPITFIPRSWNGRAWRTTGRSNVTQQLDGVTVCTGVNTWEARVLGVVEVTPGRQGIHWRTTQTTKWNTGSCAPWTTRWQEDYVLVTGMRGDAVGPALIRSFGGNLDGGFNWDVWVDRWQGLP
jgi:hypothetical protein